MSFVVFFKTVAKEIPSLVRSDSLCHHHLLVYHTHLSKPKENESEHLGGKHFSPEGSQAGQQLAQPCHTTFSLVALQDPSGSSPEHTCQNPELPLLGQEV